MKGLQVSFELNEFVASALLITVVVVAVGYFYTHQAPTEVIKESTVKVETQYIPAPAAKVNVRVVYPKLKPPTDMYIQPLPQGQAQPLPQSQPKVWDNDNLLRASNTPFKHRTPVITEALVKP